MEDFDMELAVNGQQIPARIHTYEQDNKTYYEVVADSFTVTLYKDTLYTWVAESSNSFNQDEVQSIGEQLILR